MNQDNSTNIRTLIGKEQKPEWERKNFTIPEKIICIILFVIGGTIFLSFIIHVVFIKLRKVRKEKNIKLPTTHILIIVLIPFSLLVRLARLSDSFTIFFKQNENYHFIPHKVRLMLKCINYISITELSTCFGILW